jgi:acetyltransferase-like isoleucine patch superfamily enzyme
MLLTNIEEGTIRVRDCMFGERVRLFAFVNLYGCSIGADTKIGAFVEIQKGARIGARCKISSHTFICEGVTIGDGVFVGHGVTFINDLYPRAAEGETLVTDDGWTVIETTIEDEAAIGSNATILCGLRIGRGALVGAGAVVTKDVPAGSVVAGNPARVVRSPDDKRLRDSLGS